VIATMSFRPLVTKCSDDHTPAECAKAMADNGAIAVGANCEQEPRRMLPLLREMRAAVKVPLAAQPAAFRTTDECHCFTRQPAFPDDLESIQPRASASPEVAAGATLLTFARSPTASPQHDRLRPGH
jgi:betaine-homocysteine S-methyltransferase